jgi:hypothetical protein
MAIDEIELDLTNITEPSVCGMIRTILPRGFVPA